MKLEGKTILITGSSGVIGSHFLQSLCFHVGTIYAVYNRCLPDYLKEMTEVTFIQANLTDMDSVKKLPKADIIIHGSTFSSPKAFLANPIATIKLNTLTTIELLEKLNKDGRFLYISSAEIYSGTYKFIPFKEDELGVTNTEHPRACYIEAKRCGEAICLSSGKDVKIVRPGITYGGGARIDDGRVLYDFVVQALRNHKITVNGGLHDIFSFCYVGDAVGMIWNVLLNGEKKIYNIGGGDIITIVDLANKIAKLTDSTVELIEDNRTPYRFSFMNMDRYKSEFGEWKCRNLEEGLIEVIDWYKNL